MSLELTATATDGHSLHARQEVTVLPAHYKTTALHVEEKFVQPDAATLQRIAADKVGERRGLCSPGERAVVERQFSLACALHRN